MHPASCLEPRRELERQTLEVRESLALRGIDSLLVQAHRLPVAIDTGEFGGCERVATARFRAVLRPTKELAERVGLCPDQFPKSQQQWKNRSIPL
jgi:hypothetical protein